MTLIGILLTSLVVAREWERGTMEAMLSTSVKAIHIVLGKYIPYFVLGMLSLAFNIFLCVVIFQIPFRGNYLVLFLVSGLFLFTSLGIGLNISSVLKNQFLASMVCDECRIYASINAFRLNVSDKFHACIFPALNKNFTAKITTFHL